MNRRDFLKELGCVAGAAFMGSALYGQGNTAGLGKKPNIVFIMADDMGYGDLGCLNPDSKIKTPNMDAIAREGMRFTDAHSASAVCTPTRYSVLTGRYCWRTRLKEGVLWGYSKRLIDADRMTVGSMLQKYGYRTGCVGKWHLGLTDTEPVDYSKPLRPGPNEAGFDYWFGIPASLDMKPYCYIENGMPLQPLTSTVQGEELPRFHRTGDASPGFDVDDVMPKITEKACGFIDEHARKHKDKPFFLYFPLTAPHQPWVPLDTFAKSSKAGVYGDFVSQVDWTVGEVLKQLDKHGLKDDTLIIVTSDNGSRIDHIGKFNNGVSDASKHNFGHDANYIYRGEKADIWDGGHRVPFVARWPSVVKAGRESDETICLVDLMATCADIVGYDLPKNAAEDSYSFLPVLQGKDLDEPIREGTVHHSISGKFAIRKGKWKFIDCVGSGGWSGKGDGLPGQLYNMEADPKERKNLYESPDHQVIIGELKALLEKYKKQGYSRPM